jgi:hypothetical protein
MPQASDRSGSADLPSEGPVACLTGCYPMAPHTFMPKEMYELQSLGEHIVTATLRQPEADHLPGPEKRDAAAKIFASCAARVTRLSCCMRAFG